MASQKNTQQIQFDRLKIKRVYDPPSEEDGVRILIDRLWPRGIKKSALKLDLWLKEAAPGTFLRKTFAHDPARFEAFEKEYFRELDDNMEALEPIMESLRAGTVTLLFGAKDLKNNHAVSLSHFIKARFGRGKA